MVELPKYLLELNSVGKVPLNQGLFEGEVERVDPLVNLLLLLLGDAEVHYLKFIRNKLIFYKR